MTSSRRRLRALTIARRLRPTANFLLAAFVATLSIVSTVAAATVNSQLSVSVTVLPRTAILVASMPDSLDVSARDVARGFVEVTRQSRLVVANNNPTGFELDAWPVGSVFSSVAVYGLGADATLDADGGSLYLRGRLGAAMPLTLAFRFQLAPGTRPGRYPWPLEFSIHPISAVGN